MYFPSVYYGSDHIKKAELTSKLEKNKSFVLLTKELAAHSDYIKKTKMKDKWTN